MSVPGRKLFRHWFWVLMFRYPKLRLQLTRLFLPERELDVSIFGAPLHINTREEVGLWRAARIAEENIIFRDEAASLLNLALLLRPGDVFVDIGANVGLYSSILARAPGVQVVAIEANPATARRLERSLAQRHATVLNLGASDRAGELNFASGVTSGVFKVAPGERTGGLTSVQCERLDALALPAGDLLLKIDVEDHELPVLEGAARLFQEERIKVVYLDGYASRAVPEFLQARGFRFFDGRSFAACETAPDFSLLAVHPSRLAQ